jgi:hypothetical protein
VGKTKEALLYTAGRVTSVKGEHTRTLHNKILAKSQHSASQNAISRNVLT